MQEAFDVARVALSLAFLAYASWSDLKTREVSNIVWIAFAPIALTLTLFQLFLFFDPLLLQTYVLSFAITSVISIALFYAGAFGGADAKALICLSLALPSHPTSLFQPSPSFGYSLFPITVLSNGVLLAALSAFYAIFRNCLWKFRTGQRLFEGFEKESFGRKTIALLCGYKVNSTKLEGMNHLYPLEDIHTAETGGSERRLLMFPKDEDTQSIVDRLLNAKSKGALQNDVWITPGLPMLVFITGGLVVAFFFGDLIWSTLRLILAAP